MPFTRWIYTLYLSYKHFYMQQFRTQFTIDLIFMVKIKVSHAICYVYYNISTGVPGASVQSRTQTRHDPCGRWVPRWFGCASAKCDAEYRHVETSDRLSEEPR